MLTLDQLHIGKPATIKAIKKEILAARLTEMGLFPGKHLQVLFKAPLGDPIAVDVEGYTLSLRKSEAALIQLEA